MSPILVRPVREQLEHDRIIRLLQAKAKRRYEAGINPGNERNAPVGAGVSALYPDLVMLSLERGHRLQVIVEVETGESVNHLEALAQWANFAKLKTAFHLYVPSGMVDVARRLCEDNRIHVTEIWSYHAVGDDVRFTLVHRAREVAVPSRGATAAPKAAAASGAAASTVLAKSKPKPKAAVKPRKPARSAKSARPRVAAKKPKPARIQKRK